MDTRRLAWRDAEAFALLGAGRGWSSLEELGLDDRACREPGLDVVFSCDAGKQSVQYVQTLGWIGYGASAGREVDVRGFLEVKHELGISD